MPTVREFVRQSARLVNPSNPTQPLHGDDESQLLYLLNQLLTTYAADGLLLTIAKTISIPIISGQQNVVCGPATFLPLPNITAGRLANGQEAWLDLNGVSYPLIFKSIPEFLASFKYNPLQGLPRFIIPFPDTEIVTLRLYPAPSQSYLFNLRGKFQLTPYTINDTTNNLPGYYQRYLQFALAKDFALFKGRASAWTSLLEDELVKASNAMASVSEVDLAIVGDEESLLNGAYRVQAGV